jgi:pullulanase
MDAARLLSLMLVDDGAWEVVVDENLTGWFYWYRVDGPSEAGFSHCDPEVNIVDPYALAVVDRLGPAIVVDMEAYPPPKPFQRPAETDLVIGEAHLRDLIVKAPIEPKTTDRSGFAGLTRWLQTEGCYLKEWGINAVELQPIQENDARTREEYHWGYMTVNYFAPESSYGTDSIRGAQVAEFKELVDAFHTAGLAVILDVVYNHVGEPAHLLFVDKYYYFEQSASGEMTNWSGCGNDLRCSTPMAKRLIIDSLLHLVEFYGVDGFRFDLAELIGLDALHEIEAVVKAKHPDVFLIAEPWSFRGHLGSDLKHTSYFSWNDGFRDFLKRYVKGKGDRDSLAYFLRGSPEGVGRPCQTVNYTESHDDRTWLDDITENRAHNGNSPAPVDRRRTHLMVSILMMSLGTPMLAQGQDFLRSKWGVTNTYQRGDINALDYRRRMEFSSTHSYFRNWIKFRKSPDAAGLRLAEFPADGYFRFFPASSGSGLGFLVNAMKTHGSCQLFFAVNPMSTSTTIKVDGLGAPGSWVQLADSERFDPHGLESALMSLKDELDIPPVSCALWISRIC